LTCELRATHLRQIQDLQSVARLEDEAKEQLSLLSKKMPRPSTFKRKAEQLVAAPAESSLAPPPMPPPEENHPMDIVYAGIWQQPGKHNGDAMPLPSPVTPCSGSPCKGMAESGPLPDPAAGVAIVPISKSCASGAEEEKKEKKKDKKEKKDHKKEKKSHKEKKKEKKSHEKDKKKHAEVKPLLAKSLILRTDVDTPAKLKVALTRAALDWEEPRKNQIITFLATDMLDDFRHCVQMAKRSGAAAQSRYLKRALRGDQELLPGGAAKVFIDTLKSGSAERRKFFFDRQLAIVKGGGKPK
jgi:hypothetical protein